MLEPQRTMHNDDAETSAKRSIEALVGELKNKVPKRLHRELIHKGACLPSGEASQSLAGRSIEKWWGN